MKQRLGIVGGGQLGRMLGMEAKSLGFSVTVIDPTPDSPAGQVVDRQIVAAYDDETAIRALAGEVDFLTFEIELANAGILDEVAARGVAVNPSARSLGVIKDKLGQKRWLREHGLPVADFAEVNGRADVEAAAKKFGYPVVLKARFGAYDGRGNAVVNGAEDIEAAMKKLAGRRLYVEQWVPFAKELAVVCAREAGGAVAAYPVVETIHENNICHLVIAPARVPAAAAARAEEVAAGVLSHLEGAGVFAIELFWTNDGEVLINEIAPRVHNSGHLTMEANQTSQFQQHVRAVTGLPLGPVGMTVPAAVMINILGERSGPVQLEGLDKVLRTPGVAVHIYGKSETRPERKMGHITVVADTVDEALDKAEQARKQIRI